MTDDTDLLALSRRLARLDKLAPLDRAIEADALATTLKRELARVRRTAVFEATRTKEWSDVAEALGVTESTINRLITEYRRG